LLLPKAQVDRTHQSPGRFPRSGLDRRSARTKFDDHACRTRCPDPARVRNRSTPVASDR
jgi:hypothetical protein